MAEAITNLDKQQNHHLQSLFVLHNLDASTAGRAQRIYRDLRKMQISWNHTFRLDDLMRSSIVISQKMQNIYTVTGQKIKPISLALHQMIRTKVNMKNISSIIKNYLVSAKSISSQLVQDLQTTSNQIDFGVSFVQKFQRAMEYFDFQLSKNIDWKYQKSFKSLIWSFFLLCSIKFQLNLIESDYLLISVLYLMSRHSFEYIKPKNATRVNITNKQIITTILQKLFEIFVIEDIQKFKQIGAKVDDFFDQLINSQIIICTHNRIDCLSPQLIVSNLRKIDNCFVNQKGNKVLDFRLFLHDRSANYTPIKNPHKNNNHNQLKRQVSRRVLDFDTQSIPKEQPQAKKQFQLRLPSNVKISPSYLKTPLICAYQQSPGSSAVTYMTRQAKSLKSQYVLSNKQQIIEVIKTALEGFIDEQRMLNERTNLCYSFFMAVTSKYLQQETVEQNEIDYVHCGFLVISILFTIVPFVYGQSMIQQLRTQLNKISSMIHIQGYYLWLTSRFLQKQSERLPGVLKQTLGYLQKIAINELGFTQQILQEIYILANNQQCVKFKKLDVFTQKILNQTKGQIIRLIANINVDHLPQQIQLFVYQIVKYVILQFPEMVVGKCVGQLVLWSTIMVLRIRSISIRFNDVLACYYEVNQLRNSQYMRLVNCESQSGSQNIIQFYNSVFARNLKGHLTYITPKYFNGLNDAFKRNIHQKPVIVKNPSIKKKRQQNKSYSRDSLGRKRQISRFNIAWNQNTVSNINEIQTEPVQKRNETTIRQRPIMSLVNCLKTQKNKFVKQQFK